MSWFKHQISDFFETIIFPLHLIYFAYNLKTTDVTDCHWIAHTKRFLKHALRFNNFEK